ncbi:microcyclamide/patellamide family RiPP [Limnospira fusiformis CCALA 023]
MNKKNITPNPQQPVDRVPSGQLPSALAELSEEAIGSLALPCFQDSGGRVPCGCSFNEGDDE